jgi:fumarate hydratase class I
VVLDAVQKAQGQGCAPGILGVSIGGDRGSSYVKSKEVLFSRMGTRNPDPQIAELEERLTKEANELGIGPMGFGGQTTVLDTKITGMHRLPASYCLCVVHVLGLSPAEDGRSGRGSGIRLGPWTTDDGPWSVVRRLWSGENHA